MLSRQIAAGSDTSRERRAAAGGALFGQAPGVRLGAPHGNVMAIRTTTGFTNAGDQASGYSDNDRAPIVLANSRLFGQRPGVMSPLGVHCIRTSAGSVLARSGRPQQGYSDKSRVGKE